MEQVSLPVPLESPWCPVTLLGKLGSRNRAARTSGSGRQCDAGGRQQATLGRRSTILAGLSEGAGLVVLAASAPDKTNYYDGVLVFGLTDRAELERRPRAERIAVFM